MYLVDVAQGNPYVAENSLIEQERVVQGPLPEAELLAEDAPAPTLEEAPALANAYEEAVVAPAHEQEEDPALANAYEEAVVAPAHEQEAAPALANAYEEAVVALAHEQVEAPAPPSHEQDVPEYIARAFPEKEFKFMTEKTLSESDISRNRLLLRSGDFHKLETTFGQNSSMELPVYNLDARAFPMSMDNQLRGGSGSRKVFTKTLTVGWRYFVTVNELKAGDLVQLWSFENDGKLSLLICKVRD